MCNNSTPGSSALSTAATGGQQGFAVTTGWDPATGWGSIDVDNFLVAFSTTIATSVALTATPNPVLTNSPVTLTDTITRSSGTADATGTVMFSYTTNYPGTQTQLIATVPVTSNAATTTTTFSNDQNFANPYNIQAQYSGDANYSVSTSPTVVLSVNPAPQFTITPASISYNLTAGATTGNTDLITIASIFGFAGTVNLTCPLAYGYPFVTCAILPSQVTLTSGGTGFSTLTINSSPGIISGGNEIIVTGTSGSTVATANVFASITGTTFTVNPVTTNYNLISGATTGNTDVVNLSSTGGFAGSVVMSCTATNASGTAAGSCTATSPVTLTSGSTGTSTVTINTTAGTSGVLNLTVTGTSGSTVVNSSTITANLAASSYTMAASPGTVTIPGNAATGNTSTVTLTSVNGFAGSVTVSCSSSNTAVANCTGGTGTLTAGGTATVIVTATPVIHTSGTAALTISATGTPTGGSIATTASTTVGLTVTTVNSATTVSASLATVVAGSPSTLTATVSGISLNGNPTGMVTFSAGPTVLGTGTLSTTGSVTTATYTYTPAAPSASPVIITAAYAGDSGYAPSTAAGSNLSVTGFSASVTGTTTSITVTSGATTGNTATLSFTPIGPFTGTVNFNCTISNGTAVYPPTCALSAPSINLTPGTPASVTITIITTTPKASSGGVEHTFLYKTGGVVFAMLVCLLPFRRHRLIRPLMSVIFLTGVLASPCSCSSGGGSMQTLHGSAGSYTITVTGTSGNTSATVNIPLTVN